MFDPAAATPHSLHSGQQTAVEGGAIAAAAEEQAAMEATTVDASVASIEDREAEAPDGAGIRADGVVVNSPPLPPEP